MTARPIILIGGMRLLLSWTRPVRPANDRPHHAPAANDPGSPLGAA